MPEIISSCASCCSFGNYCRTLNFSAPTKLSCTRARPIRARASGAICSPRWWAATSMATITLPQAVRNGASAILAERYVPAAGVPVCMVPDARIAFGRICQALADKPSRQLKVIGVTGTNGKTSTCWLIASVLQAAGFRAGLDWTRSPTATARWSTQRHDHAAGADAGRLDGADGRRTIVRTPCLKFPAMRWPNRARRASNSTLPASPTCGAIISIFTIRCKIIARPNRGCSNN